MRYYISSDAKDTNEILISEDQKLGRGATATVYSVVHAGKFYAAKIYHPDRQFNSEKVHAMLGNAPGNIEVIHNGQAYPQIAWPISIIQNELGNEVGFLLPFVDTLESFTLDHYYDQGLFPRLNSIDEAALSYKLEIARNLAKVVSELHSHGHYFIDFKPQNIRVFKRNHVVTLIDCDGFSINGSYKRFPAELLSTDYIAPEAQRELKPPTELGEDQDRYAIAVILFQLLNRGTHPFQGIITDSNITCNTNDEKAALGLYPYGTIRDFRIKPRPQSTHHLWNRETRRLFDNAFTAKELRTRPTAKQWADHFDSLLINKSLVRCEKYPHDLKHIRFKDMGCPACYLATLQACTPSTKTDKNIDPTRNFNQPQPVPYTQQKNSQSSRGSWFWWVICALAFILPIMVFKSDKNRFELGNTPLAGNSDSQTYPSFATAQIDVNQYVSLFASNSLAIGYSIGNSTEAKANSDSYQQCSKQIFGTNDTCKLVLSGQGHCLAISRSNDGGLGASIGSSPMSTAAEAQSACRNNGGKNCPYPTETIFCSKGL